MPVQRDMSEEFRAAMESVRTRLWDKLEQGIPVVDMEFARAHYPGIAPEFAFHMDELYLKNRCLTVQMAAAMHGPQSVAEVQRVLLQNEVQFGPEKENYYARLAILETVMRDKALSEDVRHEAEVYFVDHLTAKAPGQLLYARTIQALEDCFRLPSPSLTDEEKMASVTMLNRYFSATRGSLGTLNPLQPGSEITLDTALLADMLPPPEEILPPANAGNGLDGEELPVPPERREFRLDDEVEILIPLGAPDGMDAESARKYNEYEEYVYEVINFFRRVETVMYGKAARDYPGFDWTEAVYINGVNLSEAIDRRLKNTEDINTPENREFIRTGLLMEALMDEDAKIDFLSYNQETKSFDPQPYRMISGGGFRPVEGVASPGMNLWQRFWSMFGFYKELKAQQDLHEMQNNVFRGAWTMNTSRLPELKEQAITNEINTIEDKERALAQIVFPPDGEVPRNFDQFFNAGRSWSLLITADLMERCGMTLEQIFDPEYGREIKENSGERIRGIVDRHSERLAQAAQLAGDDADLRAQYEDQASALGARDWASVVMPWAMKQLDSKIPGDYTNHASFDEKYTEVYTCGKGLFNVFQDGSRNDVIKGAVNEWIAAFPQSSGYNPENHQLNEYKEELWSKLYIQGAVYTGFAHSAKLRRTPGVAERIIETERVDGYVEQISSACAGKQMMLSHGNLLNGEGQFRHLPANLEIDIRLRHSATAVWLGDAGRRENGFAEVGKLVSHIGEPQSDLRFEMDHGMIMATGLAPRVNEMNQAGPQM